MILYIYVWISRIYHNKIPPSKADGGISSWEQLFVQYYLIYLFWEFVEVMCFLPDI